MPIRLRILAASVAMVLLLAPRALFAQESQQTGEEVKIEDEPRQQPLSVEPKNGARAVTGPKTRRLPDLLSDFAEDEKELWTSPSGLRFRYDLVRAYGRTDRRLFSHRFTV